MSRKLTTSDRVMLLMALIPYLLEHGPTPLADLADVFEVDVKTLRRLVQFLGVAGVPGETRTYQHEDLFDIDWDALEQHDLVSLTRVVAVDDAPRFSSVETAALMAGLHELAPMLPDEMQAVVTRTAEKLASVETVDVRSSSVSVTQDPVHDQLSTITAAITDEVGLSFAYQDGRGEETQRTVIPLLLGQSSGAWYLRAFCLDRGAQRTFLVDRMRDSSRLALSPQHRDGPHAAEALSRAAFSVDPSAEHATVTVKLRVLRRALHRIADFTPTVLTADSRQNGAEVPSGWVYAEVELLHPSVAARLVQAAPSEVVVESPHEAREAVREWADRALAGYDG